MQAFEWANAKTAADAVRLLGPGAAADYDETFRPIGGGQDLHTTLKAYIHRPARVVNLKTIPDAGKITVDGNSLILGATATLTEIETHPEVIRQAPGLAESIHSVATPQIRNFGTIGGNLCQRPRCWYFRLEEVKCLKRGGDTCYAKEGENKYLAAFGTDAPCVITKPSDPAQVLVALNAVVNVLGPKGERQINAGEFFRMPTTDDPRRENVLAADEIITSIRVPLGQLAAKSTYLKFKERESLDFAMASVAAAVDADGALTVRSARVVLGGVAPVPWALPAVDAFLAGETLDEATIARAAEMAIEGAKPLSQTRYKLPLVRTLVQRSLTKLARSILET
ncbi:MAG TPA: FAD binding domain-containing protein [Tepidisphaeraceae bacterium]|jgi:xanthine dehydrogenase YagS FAD-binding subunit